MLFMEKQNLLFNIEELKDQELHDDSVNTPSELQYTVINIVLTGFEDPITIVSSGKFEEFEDFWMSSTIDQDISNFLEGTAEDS